MRRFLADRARHREARAFEFSAEPLNLEGRVSYLLFGQTNKMRRIRRILIT